MKARMPADVPDLCCPACDRSYPAGPDEPWRCSCGGPLELDAAPTLPGDPPSPGTLGRDAGLWAFADWLPVAPRTTLGAGWTPLVSAPDFGCAFKLEYVFPSGSFKDRGAETTLSRAVALGVERVVEDSSGNAGAAIAQYAARAGLDATIYVPAEAKPAKLAAIERVGARIEPIEGDRQAVTDACVEAVEQGAGWYASHAWNPAFYAGTATFAFEVCAQRGWTAPDAVVLPLGHGTLLIGAFRGFTALHDAGIIEQVPRLLAVQAAGVAPVAEAVRGDAGTGKNDLADGIQIQTPARHEEVLRAIRETDGDAITVDQDSTQTALSRLRKAGFYVEPTSAAAPAGLAAYRAAGALGDEDVVVPLTGSGLKDT